MSVQKKLTTIAENVTKVYEAGVAEGKVQGRKEQYDEFWDALQQNGNLTYYKQSFSGYGWNVNNFYPKYDIVMGTAFATFQEFNMGNSSTPLNLRERLEECGVKLIVTTTGQMGSTFYNACVSEIPELDISTISSLNTTFGNCWYLHTLALKIADSGKTLIQSSAFTGCSALVNFKFTGGVVAQNGLNLSSSTKLSKASIENIIEHLSTTTSGLSVTLSKTAVNTAFNTTDPSTCEEWLALRNTRFNWTISLA